DLDFVHGRVLGVVRRGRVEEAAPPALGRVELGVGVRPAGQRPQPHQLAADVQEVVDTHLVPRLQTDACPGRVVVAEGGVRLRGATEGGALNRLAGRV